MFRMPSDSSLKRVRIIGFSLLLVLVPFVVYYYFWVSNQTKYFTGRDLRVLAALTRHVEESVKSQGDVFTNAVKKFLANLELNPAEEDTEENAVDKPTTAYKRLQTDRESVKLEFQRQSLNLVRGDGTNLTVTNLDLVSKPADESLLASPKIEVKQEDNQRFLYFSYTTVYPALDSNFGKAAIEGKGQEPLYLNFKVKTNLADLIGQFVDKRQIEDNEDSYGGDGFDAIVLAEVDDAVNVIFQESSAKLRLASLNNLTGASDGSKIDLKLLGQSTNMADVKVGAGDYKLFFQPVQLPLERLGSNDKKQISWMVCGFVESGRFRRESWAVSYTVLIIFFFLAALVALSWPFLKLLLIGPKDRLRPIDTYLLVVSAVMITALLTLFGIFSASYTRAEKLLDTALESFAGDLQKNFEKELGNALTEIDELNCSPKLIDSTKYLLVTKRFGGFQAPRNCPKTQAAPTVPSRETQASLAQQAPLARQQAPLAQQQAPLAQQQAPLAQQQAPLAQQLLERLSASETLASIDRRLILTDEQLSYYPYFISAFWVNTSGKQQIKWTTRQNLTNNVSVVDREYFFKPRMEQHYTYGEHKFYLQPIVSKTTGQNEVTISKAITPFNNPQVWISAINTRMLSLAQPVIPSGFGFAVIDGSGKVLFHSDEKRHLGENFFEESDNNQELRAAVLGRSNQLLSVSYLGKGHSMYVRPMGVSQFGWTVIAFRNKDFLRTTFSEIMSLCLVLFFAHLIFTLIVLLVVYLINRTSRDPVAWLWPAPDKTRIYTSLTVLNIFLIFLSLAAVRWLPGLWKIGVPVATSLSAILLFVWLIKREKESHLSTKLIERLTKRNFLNHRAVYTLNATLLFALISIIPAYACFKLAYVEEMKLFIKEGQLDLARDLAQREERLRSQYSITTNVASRQDAMKKFLANRLDDTGYDVYNSFFFQTKLEDAAANHSEERDNKLIRFFKNFVPLFNQSSIQRHALLWPAADQSWKWEERSSGELILHVNQSLTSSQATPALHIVSTLPRMNGSVWWFIWPVLLTIVALLVTYMCRQIFLFKRNERACDELNGFTADSVSQNLFLVLNPPFVGRRELLRRLGLDKGTFERIDVQQSAEVEKWFKHRNPPASPGTTQPPTQALPIILDNFDYGCENAAYNQQRLRLLEKLFELKRVAIAVSNLEPDRFMSGKSDGNTENGTSPVMTERWTGAVSRFLRVSLEDFGEPGAFKTTVTNRKKQVLSDDKLTPEAKQQIEAVFVRIERECSPRACLQSIGEGIANQRNIGTQTPEGITRQVFVQAMPYYKSIWRVCSDDEKLTLSHLAHDGLLSSNDPDLERLMKKGLIVREPAVRLMNESFKYFVLGVEDGETLAHCEEKARKSSNWEALKVPLSIGVASVIVFLLLTQREIYNSTLPIITAITAGVPTFFKLISVFHGDSAGKSGG